jgi:type VI secretion system protein ImpK
MSPQQTPGSAPARSRRPGWLQWLRLLAAAGVLLAVSEVLWIWQTWPVRDLLQPASASAPLPGSR